MSTQTKSIAIGMRRGLTGQRRRTLVYPLMMLSLLLALPVTLQPAYAQQSIEPATDPDCSHSPAGQYVPFFREDEIVVGARSKSNKALEYIYMENHGANVDWGGNWFGTGDMTDVRWPAIAMADLNGDTHQEAVLVFRDKQKRLGATTDYNLEWFVDDSTNKTLAGDNVEWLDVAAGDLDSSSTNDKYIEEEVVIAFADDNHDMHLVVLDGNASGKIAQSPNQVWAEWVDGTNAGRGDVDYVAVATGDLNGDGHDNEIVVAFQDSNNDLQALILHKASGSYWLTLDWWRAWTNHDRGDVANDDAQYENMRPIDVTTGDLDGDHVDEVVMAFRSGPEYMNSGDFQMLVLDNQGDNYYDDSVYWVHGAGCGWQGAVTSVSVAAGDIEGDGQDEIALGYNRVCAGDDAKFWQQHLRTFDYVPVTSPDWQGCLADSGGPAPCLQMRTGYWDSVQHNVPLGVDEENPEALVVVDTGDLDQDGKAEIALIHQEHQTVSGKPQYTYVRAFDADTGLTQRDWEAISWGSDEDKLEEFWLAMGDLNGDSWYGSYTGACGPKTEVQVTSVIHAPPHWEENDWDAEASFGESLGSGGGTSSTTETKIGGSVTGHYTVEEIGPSFTYGWEESWAVETTKLWRDSQGAKFMTASPHSVNGTASSPNFGAVGYQELYYWCYDYNVPAEVGASPMSVCFPRPESAGAAAGITSKSIEWWYDEGITKFPETWVPLGINLALGQPAAQSGTTGGILPASRAVDGNTNGDLSAGSVSETAHAQNAHWQVDLGDSHWIDAIQIWNRTDCCAEVLDDYYVFGTNNPWYTNWPVFDDPDIWYIHMTEQAGRPTTIAVNKPARYLRIQLADSNLNYLTLAEVQVWGGGEMPDQWPSQKPLKVDDDTFRLSWPSGVTRDVDGQVQYQWPDSSALLVDPEANSVEFDLGHDVEGEQIVEGSTGSEVGLGMEVRRVETEVTYGTTQKTSSIQSWSKELEVAGQVAGHGLELDEQSYTYKPYVWLQRVESPSGKEQAFLTLDYWVPSIGLDALAEAGAVRPALRPLIPASPNSPGVTPQAPLIASPSHPNPDAWYTANAAVFTWVQPPGDPATVVGYRWFLDRNPDTVPLGINMGPDTGHAYPDLRDGVWYLHVRALGDDDQWSETAHRAIRIDTAPPELTLALDPPLPSGNNGWYVNPVTVTVTAQDDPGSGVGSIEVTTDGVAWQPYTAPWVFGADTPSATVYARATDVAGNISEPVTATFKIDRTAPDSHVSGGPGAGAIMAEVVTNSAGNQDLVLAGVIADDHSGRAGMSLGYDDLDWSGATPVGSWHPFPAQPEIEVNWYFTATDQIGAGYHIFTGRAQDQAGNQEDAYEIGRVVWFPRTSPDLGGSSLSISPRVVRPGDVVTLSLVVRNGGFQEAHAAVSEVLPEGLTPLPESLGPGVTYDPDTRTLAWPSRLLWPAWWRRYTILARVDAGLPVSSLETRAILRAFWPNTDLLPPDQRQRFLDHEQTVVATAQVLVNPDLSPSADFTAPWVTLLRLSEQAVSNAQVRLRILATPDARWMYLREWTLDPRTGAWTVTQDSGWRNYSEEYTWALSPGQGVKYLGVWVADAASNVSTLDEHGLTFVNRIDGDQALSDGDRVQYRGLIHQGTFAAAYLTTLSGDPDLYLWGPRNAFLPDLYRNDSALPGQVEDLGQWFVERSGRYLLEVLAMGDSEYQITLGGDIQEPAVDSRAQALAEKPRPPHPLTVSDPLSAGQLGTPVTVRSIYLPVMLKTN